jgi:hypothetical protein
MYAASVPSIKHSFRQNAEARKQPRAATPHQPDPIHAATEFMLTAQTRQGCMVLSRAQT